MGCLTCVLLTFLISFILGWFPFPLNTVTWGLFGSKLTFLSILLAAGFFQYGYFYKVFLEVFNERVPEWESWDRLKNAMESMEDTIEQLQKITPLQPLYKKMAKDRLNLKFEQLKRPEVVARLRRDIDQFSAALSLQFGIASCLFLSLGADLIDRVLVAHRVWIALSFGSLFSSLFVFVVMAIYYGRVVIVQLRGMEETIKKFDSV